MRIWIVHQNAIPPSETGSTRHHHLAAQLIAFGHEVLIIASSFLHAAKKDVSNGKRPRAHGEICDGVPFLWIRSPGYAAHGGGARLWNMTVFANRVRRGLGLRGLPKPDLILGSTPSMFAAWAAGVLARRYGVPFVLEVRDIWPQTIVDLGAYSERHLGIRVLARLERHLYSTADHILCLLPHAAAHMVAKGARADAITWVPNGIALERVPTPSDPPQRAGLVFVYAGSHGTSNALTTLLDAAKIVQERGNDEIAFRFVGDGPHKPKLVQYAEALGLRNTDFRPAVPKAKVYEVLADADAFVLCTPNSRLYRHGISSSKLYDYLAMARPIAYATASRNDVIREANAGLSVGAEDPPALADAVLEIAAMSPEERRRLGANGRKHAEEHFSYERLAERLEHVFRELVESPATARDL